MKLYSILFEQAEKEFISYTPPKFALYVQEGYANGLVLINCNKFLQSLKNTDISINDYIAGMIMVEDSYDGCLGAKQVTNVAGSPSYKGAGITMYALASDYFGSPLTSDRGHSSSVAAIETWTKIENSSEWKKVGQGLDNYRDSDLGKNYFKISGTHPNRKALNLGNTPATPEEIDDCPLPTKQGSVLTINDTIKILGTADAYKYNGPLKAKPLIDRWESLKDQINSDPEKHNPDKFDLDEQIEDAATWLFNSRYKGSETTR